MLYQNGSLINVIIEVMEIKYEFEKGSTQQIITDCPHKKKSGGDDITWFIKVGSASCAMCKHNKGIDSEKQTVSCNK